MSVKLYKYWFNLNIAFRACPDNVLWVSFKDPPVEKVIPRYTNLLTISSTLPWKTKDKFLGKLPPFRKIIILVFSVFTVGFHFWLYSLSTANPFCKPSLVLEKITISSAYKSKYSLSIPMSIPSTPFCISSLSKSLLYMPCLTPALLNLTLLLIFLYIACMTFKILPLTPFWISLNQSISLTTKSKAFLKSINAEYIFFVGIYTMWN